MSMCPYICPYVHAPVNMSIHMSASSFTQLYEPSYVPWDIWEVHPCVSQVSVCPVNCPYIQQLPVDVPISIENIC